MELSNDQKAILRLLAQRGSAGYEDLTALLGVDAAAVHERAQAAAAQLEADGIPAPSIPSPPAGTAAPTPPAAVETPRADPPTAATPSPPQPPAPAPAAPPKPAACTGSKPTAPPPLNRPAASGSPRRPNLSIPKSGSARAALAAALAIVVALVVVLAVSGGDDSGETGDSASGGDTTSAEETVDTSANPKLTQAILDPVDGGDAKGVATFGRLKDALALQVEAEGLAPTEKGQSYTIWLYESAEKMLPLASTAVGENGRIGAQVEVPVEVLAYLANETFEQLNVSLTEDATLKASLAKATKEKEAPIYTGTDVLRGTITGPIIGAAKKAKENE